MSDPTEQLTERIRWIGGIFGSLATLTAILYTFGFLSDKALFAYAGLPQLSTDYTATTEAGASGLVETFRVVLDDRVRRGLMGMFVASLFTVWVFHERWPTLRRLLESPTAHAVSQCVLLLLLSATVTGELAVAKLADETGRAAIRQELARETVEVRGTEAWDPTHEATLYARSTYPTEGLLELVSPLLADNDEEPKERLQRKVSGYPLRKREVDRDNAQRLYGWTFLFVAFLATLTVLSIVWRIGLSRGLASVRPGAPDGVVPGSWRHHRRVRVLQASKWILELAMLFLLVLMVGLLPSNYGILMHSSIGNERVVVRMNPSCTHREDAVDAPEPSPPGAERGDMSTRDEPSDFFVLPTAADVAPGESPDGVHVCAASEAYEAERLRESVARSLSKVARDRNDEHALEEALEQFRGAVDELARWTEKSKCSQGLEAMGSLVPASNLFSSVPDAANYFLERWLDLRNRLSDRREGYILTYPRGESRDEVVIFEAVVDRDLRQDGRWIVESIPRRCIADITVAPTRTHEKLLRMQQNAQRHRKDVASDFARYIHPTTVDAILDSLARPDLLDQDRGVMITELGTQVGALRQSIPWAAMKATDRLIGLIFDDTMSDRIRSSAATSLHVIGGEWAARRLVSRLEHVDATTLHDDVLGALVTATGQLARDYREEIARRQLWSRQFGTGADAAPPMTTIDEATLGAIESFLEHIIRDDQSPAATLGVAVAAAHFGRFTDLRDAIIAAVRGSCPATRGSSPSARCQLITGQAALSLRVSNTEPARGFMQQVASDRDFSAHVRMEAINSLYSLGMYGEHALMVELALDRHAPEVSAYAARFVEDVDGTGLFEDLEGCLSDPGRDLGARSRCALLSSLSDVDDDAEGRPLVSILRDELIARRAADGARAPASASYQTALMVALVELATRGNFEAYQYIEDDPRLKQQFGRYRQAAPIHRRQLALELFEDLVRSRVGTTPALPALQNVDGERVDWTSDRVTIIDLWASWCHNCDEAAAVLSRLSTKYGRAVRLLCVNQGESADEVRRASAELGMKGELVLDPDEWLSKELEVEGLPTILVLDASGTVTYEQSGVADLEQNLDRVLGGIEPGSPPAPDDGGMVTPSLPLPVETSHPDLPSGDTRQGELGRMPPAG